MLGGRLFERRSRWREVLLRCAAAAACASEAARSSCRTSASSDRNSRFIPSGPGFRRAAAADDASLIGGAVRRHEGIRRILARQPFGDLSLFHKKRGLQARQKLFCGRTQRIAELHQAIEARNGFRVRSRKARPVRSAADSACAANRRRTLRVRRLRRAAWRFPRGPRRNVSTTTYSSSSRRNCSMAFSYSCSTSA